MSIYGSRRFIRITLVIRLILSPVSEMYVTEFAVL